MELLIPCEKWPPAMEWCSPLYWNILSIGYVDFACQARNNNSIILWNDLNLFVHNKVDTEVHKETNVNLLNKDIYIIIYIYNYIITFIDCIVKGYGYYGLQTNFCSDEF